MNNFCRSVIQDSELDHGEMGRDLLVPDSTLR